jgi:hypothetical protein
VNLKLGKKAPKRLLRMPALGDFLPKATSWPVVPARGWELEVPAAALDILGNDQYGDCAEAGALHLIQAQSYNAGRPLIPTTEDALNLYSAVTGFNRNDPSTDQGTALTDLLTYWQKTGITVGGQVHKILGSASLDITSIAQMRYATYLFGGSYLGINCPEKCQQDTSNWNFGPGLPIDGGHCIIRAGEGAAGGKTGSWGMWIPTSNEFYLSYVDEAYVVVTEDWLDVQGKSPSGLDVNGLLDAMAAL